MNIIEEKGIEVAEKGIPKVRIYNDADDKNVAATLIFENGSKYYYDSASLYEVPTEDYKKLYTKGVVIKAANGTLSTPIGLDENGAFIFGGSSDLPEVTSADNGKVLTVVDGAWDKADAQGGGDTPEVIVDETVQVAKYMFGMYTFQPFSEAACAALAAIDSNVLDNCLTLELTWPGGEKSEFELLTFRAYNDSLTWSDKNRKLFFVKGGSDYRLTLLERAIPIPLPNPLDELAIKIIKHSAVKPQSALLIVGMDEEQNPRLVYAYSEIASVGDTHVAKGAPTCWAGKETLFPADMFTVYAEDLLCLLTTCPCLVKLDIDDVPNYSPIVFMGGTSTEGNVQKSAAVSIIAAPSDFGTISVHNRPSVS